MKRPAERVIEETLRDLEGRGPQEGSAYEFDSPHLLRRPERKKFKKRKVVKKRKKKKLSGGIELSFPPSAIKVTKYHEFLSVSSLLLYLAEILSVAIEEVLLKLREAWYQVLFGRYRQN